MTTMRHFDEQLKDLLEKIVLMGSMVEAMIRDAVRALMERNDAPMRSIYEREREVDQLQMEVDEMAVRLTALQQPVAADVRFLFMASRIVTELERIGDQAINICENTKYVLQFPPMKPMVDVPIMAEVAQRMVRDGLTALIERRVEVAEAVLEQEATVDAFKDQIFRTLLTYMMADPGTIQRALSLILISRNLERIGDHATNIAEEVIYLVNGKDVRHPKRMAATAGEPKAY
jgi:phosphate transport system protein